MIFHTIVVQIPEGRVPTDAERRITESIERVAFGRQDPKHPGGWINDFVKVVEYHHEKMTESGDE